MKNRRGLIFLVIALGMGAAAFSLSTRLVGDPVASGETPNTTPVVVVRTDVPVASALSREHLQIVDWPSDHIPAGSLKTRDQAVGRIVRRPLAAGEPVLEIALFETGASGGLRAVIKPGHRAVSVKVDNVIGVAGFITPGVHVDVMATLRRVDLSNALPYSKVILQNVPVLAVDQKLEEVKSGDPELVSVVTLEVDPLQAEHLIYAAHEGRLQLAMRSPGDVEEVASRSIGVVDILGQRKPIKIATRTKTVPRTRIELINGSTLEIKKF